MPETSTPDHPLLEAARYLRQEGDFNRSWIDGRRSGWTDERYIASRLAHAEMVERWAAAIEAAHTLLAPGATP